ncbi:MAG TPA: NUDIX domain-containing protein [Candidatus Limnocylindrales bacterium]|nr:NUDIX domain-containing protein [Candidatus Limnocylindrales bacterium]
MDRDFEGAKDLLLEDYRYRARALQDSEKLGENRLNLFVGFCGALLTAAGFGVKELGLNGRALQLLLASLLSALFAIGVLIFIRLIARDDHTDLCKRDLDEIRQRFKDHAPDMGPLFGYYAVGVSGFGRRTFGGSKDFMMAVNGILLTALVGVILFVPWPPDVGPTELQRIIIALAAGVVGYRAQAFYAERRHALSRAVHFARRPTHAGGVVFRRTDSNPEILLTVGKAKADAGVWALPKGHIERGEGHAEAAAREVREETSVVAAPRRMLDVVEYRVRGERVRAKYYLMEYLYDSYDNDPVLEHRPTRWLSFVEAATEVRHPETSYLLSLAEREYARLAGGSPTS